MRMVQDHAFIQYNQCLTQYGCSGVVSKKIPEVRVVQVKKMFCEIDRILIIDLEALI